MKLVESMTNWWPTQCERADLICAPLGATYSAHSVRWANQLSGRRLMGHKAARKRHASFSTLAGAGCAEAALGAKWGPAGLCALAGPHWVRGPSRRLVAARVTHTGRAQCTK